MKKMKKAKKLNVSSAAVVSKPEPVSFVAQPPVEKPLIRIIHCTNLECGHCSVDTKNKESGHCKKLIIHLEKTWAGSEREWTVVCLEATNQTAKHDYFLKHTINQKPLNKEETK